MQKLNLFENMQIFNFKNGFNLILKKDSSLPITSLQLWIKAGSLNENQTNNGISHFVEHMVFKGTEKFKVGDVSKIVESYGGKINASTSKEFTNYWIDIPKNGIFDSLKILYELVFKGVFSEEEFEKEKFVIFEEIKRSEDVIEDTLFEEFNKMLFTETNYKYRVIGSISTVSSLKKSDLLSYYKTFYSPNNMILICVGDINIDEIIDFVNRNFAQEESQALPPRSSSVEPLKGENFKLIKKETENVRMLTGFLGPSFSDEDRYSADFLSVVLGGGLSSRFNRKLREEKRLVWDIDCGFYSQESNGIFFISVYCPKENYEKVKDEIVKELKNLIQEKIDNDEMERVRRLIESSYVFGHQTFHSQAATIGYWFSMGRLDLLERYLDMLLKVDNDSIIKFLTKYYKGLTTCIIYPAHS